jgi:predicted dehydrogenase
MAAQQAVSRRNFLHHAGASAVAAVAAPYMLTSGALGAPGKPPASERVLSAHIGVGGMGMGTLRGRDGVAAADVYLPHAERAAGAMGAQCQVYQDYRRCLERDDIDAVVIATPDHWHALTSIHAMQAGKDVYCQKPLTLTIEEGQAIVATAKRYGRVFQTGSQQRSGREFLHAVELVRSGRIGKLRRVHVGIGGGPTCGWDADTEPPTGLDWNMYLGPAPAVPFNTKRFLGTFRWFWDYSGGMLTDWGVHHNDIAQWGNDTDQSGPVEIEGTGTLPTDGLFQTLTNFDITYTYANGVTVTTDCKPPWGVTFHGTNGEVYVRRGQYKVTPEDLDGPVPEGVTGVRRPHGGHMSDFEHCCRTREKPVAHEVIGHRTCTMSHLGNIAIRVGRKIHWNPDTEQIVGDPEAARWTSKPMRAPWHL